MNKKIEFSYDGKDYTLEYDRKSVRVMEANGLRINEIATQPYSMLEILWTGAFLKNHKNENNEKILDIYKHIKNKEELNAGLVSMFNETYTSLIGNDDSDESKNIEWKMN